MPSLRGLTAVLAVVAAVSAGCRGDDDGSPPGVVAIDQSSQEVPRDGRGAVFSLRLVNRSAEPVALGDLVPVADPQLTVDVLGLATCQRGCVGAAPLDAESETKATGSVDADLVTLPPSARGAGTGPLSLVVVLRWSGAAPDNCAYLRAVTSRTATGTVRITATDGAWLAAIVPSGSPAAARGC